jgi:flagellar biosynthesis protein FlhA
MSTIAAKIPAQPAGRWRVSEVSVVVSVVLILALLVLPLPAFMLDLLLAASIASSVMVLLVALYTVDPLEFSVFPTALLLLTLFRLALNVSSTRLILSKGEAGDVIEAFGNFVIGGNYAVGIILFVILIIINFVVITKGAGRIAEVAARFTLDAMPGRQMSIDADLSAGLIDDAEAKRRREEISQEADFYGAMDGAAKFVRGDAIAGLLIAAINIVGGIFIGVVQRGMPIGRAADHYTILTVGDGLVSQVPALIVSTAAGIMVTYSSGGSRLGNALVTQVGRQPRALWLAAGFLATLGIVPGLPTVPFLALAGLTAIAARAATKGESEATVALQVAKAEAQEIAEIAPPETTVGDLLQVDPVELEVGYGLIPLVDERQGGDLLERIRLLRKQAAMDLGILIPRIRIRDDIRLAPNEYVIRLRGNEIGRAELMPRMLLALDTGGAFEQVDGIPAQDPSFGMNGVWVHPQQREEAEGGGYVVVEPSTVVSTHLMETLKLHAADLLGRQDVQELVDTLKKSYPALVDEVIPAKISLGVLHRVLQRLLKERVPIRDLVTVLEALADVADQTKDPEALTEHVRRALGKAIAEQYADETGTVRGIGVSPRLEMALMGFFSPRAAKNPGALPSPEQLTDLLRRLDRLARNVGDGRNVPLISPPGLRVGIRRLIEPVLPNIPVVSLAELPAQVNVQSIATWDMSDEG